VSGGSRRRHPSPSDVMLSYLPLWPRRERVFHHLVSQPARIQVHFAESIEDRARQPSRRCSRPFSLECHASGRSARRGAIRIRLCDLAQAHVQPVLLRSLTVHRRPPWCGTVAAHLCSRASVPSAAWYYRALRDRLACERSATRYRLPRPSPPEVLRSSWGIACRCTSLRDDRENTAIATANSRRR